MVKELYDKRLKFYSRSHKYKVDGVELESVTKFVHRFFKPFKEREVARKLNKMKGTKWYRMGVKNILKEWKGNREYGSLVHDELEKYLLYNQIPCDSKALAGVSYLSRKLDPTDEYHPEVVVYSSELGVAGTVDLLLVHLDGSVTIVDWKTNKAIRQSSYNGEFGSGACSGLPDCNYSHYLLQLNIYAYLLKFFYGFEVRGLELVHLIDGDFVVYNVDLDVGLVERCFR